MGQELIGKKRVFTELRRVISKALDVDAESIGPESVLTLDLNAESLDFLDISYNLEQAFGFKMARHFVLEHAEEIFGEGSAIDEEGCLTPEAIRMLKLRFKRDPFPLKPGMDMDEVANLVTVGSMAETVMDILDSLPETCPRCGESTWKTEDETRVVCGSCGSPAPYRTGDDLTVEWLKEIQEKERIF